MNANSNNLTGSADEVRNRLGLNPHKRRRRIVWLLLSLVAAVILVLGARAYWQHGAEERLPKYQTEAVVRADIHVTVSATGNLRGINTVEVGAEVTGKVLHVLVDYNDQISKGQVLAEIDPEQLQAAVNEALARLLSADSSIQTADATQTEAIQSRARAMAQSEQGLIAQMDLERAQAAAARAVASLASARANWALANAALQSARSRLRKTKILAPIDGIVLARLVESGQTVTAGFQTPVLFKLAEDLTKLELHVDVDESDIGRVRVGMRGRFSVDAYAGREFPTEILSLRNDPKMSQNVVTYEAVLSVQNQDRALRPGMTATAIIVSKTIEQALVIPNSALRFEPPKKATFPPKKSVSSVSGKRVYVLDTQGLTTVSVEVGTTDGHASEIVSSGLEVGTQVVVDVAR